MREDSGEFSTEYPLLDAKLASINESTKLPKLPSGTTPAMINLCIVGMAMVAILALPVRHDATKGAIICCLCCSLVISWIDLLGWYNLQSASAVSQPCLTSVYLLLDSDARFERPTVSCWTLLMTQLAVKERFLGTKRKEYNKNSLKVGIHFVYLSFSE